MPLAYRTERAYRAAGERFDRIVAALGVPKSAVAYLRAITGGAVEWAKSYWRFIKAAIKWWIRVTISEAEAEHFAQLAALAKRDHKKRKVYPKRLPDALHDTFISALTEGRQGRNKAIAADLLVAGRATGLRPCEWARARLEGDTLVVQNAKYRPGISGNGAQRTLLLDPMIITEEERSAIARLLSTLRGTEWERVGGGIRRAFGNIKKRLKALSMITQSEAKTRIYEARHQFSANAKETLDYAAGEVAAAMGHRVAVTAHVAYGRRSFAANTLPVQPSRDSIARVDPRSISKLAQSLAKAAAFKLTGAWRAGVSALRTPSNKPVVSTTRSPSPKHEDSS